MNVILQWGINLVLVGGFLGMWFETKKRTQRSSDVQLKDTLQKLESRLTQMETELEKFQHLFDEKTKALDSVFEQFNKILRNNKMMASNFPLTQEESELKEALYVALQKDEIPSVAQFETTKIRLQKESSLDLKTLLKGQLA
ncbi:MAG: hypothetical protein ACKOA8_09760 [Deltaproteobacteria bacterium]